MEIKIESAEQFDNLLKKLSDDIVYSEVYFKLRKDLLSSIEEYKDVFIQSNTFWTLTSTSLLITTLSLMCRVYDQHSKSLSLINLLETVKANIPIFSVSNFKERLSANPFVGSLSLKAREPNIEALDKDICLVKENDALVKKLIIWRNNLIAHRTASSILDKIDITQDYPLSLDEIQELIDRAVSLLNKYSGLFSASSYLTQIVGHDDYLYILKTVNESVQKYQDAMKALIKKSRQ